jgi:hypothetical protein
MLSKCANPDCSAPFHYLREGKLFQIESGGKGPQLVSHKRPPQRIEYFWLCGSCADSMTLALHGSKGVVTIPLPGRGVRRAAAS